MMIGIPVSVSSAVHRGQAEAAAAVHGGLPVSVSVTAHGVALGLPVAATGAVGDGPEHVRDGRVLDLDRET